MRATCACVGSVIAIPIVAAIAFGQAVDVGGEMGVAVEVSADQRGCAIPDCVRLSILARNAGQTQRFVSHDLVDVSRLRLSADEKEFRLLPLAGTQHSRIQERLDPAGGLQDHLLKTYIMPGCCTVKQGDERLDNLPPGTYVVTYEPPPGARGGSESSGVHVPASSTTFTINGPRATRAEP